MAQLVFSPADLAPGDTRSTTLDLSEFRFDRILSTHDPLFELAYASLWAEFGATGEMETRAVLEQRFQRAPEILYEMILVRRGGEFVAVRDHTAIVADPEHGGEVVHLSHNLVAPAARRTGLAGWMRALPVATARAYLAARGVTAPGRITLVSEMAHSDPAAPEKLIRLQAYEKAGFRTIDPAQVPYHQPDFRPPEEIDATSGPRPLPFRLVIRRVGREHERVISGAEVRALTQALLAIYGPEARPADLAHPLLSLDRYPEPDATIALLPPSQC